MPTKPATTHKQLLLELKDLRARLDEAEETLRAIRSGEVDALVVSGAGGEQVFTLKGADHPYRMLIEDMQEGALTLTRDGMILYANRSFAGMLKTSLENVIGSTLHAWIAPDSQGILQALMQRGGDEKRREELFLIAGDGSQVPVYLSVNYLSTDELNDSFCVVAIDMTEHRRLEEASRETDAKFRYIFENSPLGKSLIGVDGTLKVNSAFCNILGYSETELHAKNWEAITHPDDIQKNLDIIQALMAGERSGVLFEKRYIHKNGNIVWADVTTALQRDESGKPLYFLTTISDITKRKHADEEIRILNTELEKRVQERTAELESANKELEAFSYSVSHDLRAPLRAIDGFSRILLEKHTGGLDSEGARYFQLVRDNARRMGQLVDDLLAFSRLGRQSLTKKPVSPRALVDQALADLQAEIGGRKIDIAIAELPECQADSALLKQVFFNLLANAVKFTRVRETAHIEIGLEQNEGEIVYFVRDNGVGFDMRYENKLFGVFQRLHSAEEFEGTGVGLAIVQRIVHRHGGRVWAEAEVDKGATFYFAI